MFDNKDVNIKIFVCNDDIGKHTTTIIIKRN